MRVYSRQIHLPGHPSAQCPSRMEGPLRQKCFAALVGAAFGPPSALQDKLDPTRPPAAWPQPLCFCLGSCQNSYHARTMPPPCQLHLCAQRMPTSLKNCLDGNHPKFPSPKTLSIKRRCFRYWRRCSSPLPGSLLRIAQQHILPLQQPLV